MACQAQSFTDNLQKKEQGKACVTISQSKEIDNLVNSAKLEAAQKEADAKKLEQQAQKAAQHANQATHQDHKHTGGNANGYDSSAHKPDSDSHNRLAGHHTQQEASGTAQRETAPADEAAGSTFVKKVPKSRRKVTGYRIQAFSGGNSRADRQKAERTGSAIKMRYPNLPIYVHFYNPRWICRVGNFRSYSEAARVLKDIKAMGYSQACIVKGKINLGY